ncbi:MAG: hypothetical protein ACRCYU_06530 [Nocardioides sp.]
MKTIPVRTVHDEVDSALEQLDVAVREANNMRVHLERVHMHTDISECADLLRGARRVGAIMAAAVEQAQTHVREAQYLS